MSMSFNELYDEVNEFVRDTIINESTTREVKYDYCHKLSLAGKLPIDIRSIPPKMWVNEEMILVRTANVGRLNYYGGFEYVEKEFVNEIADYTVFSVDSDRVRKVIDALLTVEA